MTGTPPSYSRRVMRDPAPAQWADARNLLLVACDPGYFPHAAALVRSLDVFSPGEVVMIHLVNPDDATLGSADALVGELESTRLLVSTERVVLPIPDAKAAYYASARFLRTPELVSAAIKHAGRGSRAPGVLALDADSLAIAPVGHDFSDKAEAEVCVRRRDLDGEDVAEHLRVAAGAFWVRGTQRALAFAKAVASDLEREFEQGSAAWFVDQTVLGRHVLAETAEARVRNLKSKFIDWDFRDDAVFWMAKGDRKYLDVRYLLLREALDGDLERRRDAAQLLERFVQRVPGDRSPLSGHALVRVAHARRGGRVGIYLPRLDLPWKRESMAKGVPPFPNEDVIALRLWWKRFAMSLAHALARRNADVVLHEIPAWEIEPARIDADELDLAFVPHRCRLDFGPTATPVRFFMQEYFRPVFVVDRDGWSAASSRYPVDAARLPPAVLGAWDDYRAAFESGNLESKFEQRPPRSRDVLVAAGEIPAEPYLFFPLQIPHDQSLRYFSDVDELDAVEAAARLAAAHGRTLLLKEHPANRRSMAPFRERFSRPGVAWTEAHVHDALSHAECVVTLNSGVGFEALLAERPLVTLARVEYDAVAHRATLATLEQAYLDAIGEDLPSRRTRYARFVDWFLGRYAVDLSRPWTSGAVLDRIVREAIVDARAGR